MAQQLLTEDVWSEQYVKLNNMFQELFLGEGLSHIAYGEDNWFNVSTKLNVDFATIYQAKGATGRLIIGNREHWGSIKDKINTMFALLYSGIDQNVLFTVLDDNQQPVEGADVTVEQTDVPIEPSDHEVTFTVIDNESNPIEEAEINIIEQ